MKVPAATILLTLAGPAGAVCLDNHSDQRLFGASESEHGAGRVTGWLDPGGRLCSGRPDEAGTVGVFDSSTAFEDCSRRVQAAAGPARLLEFTRFDRCRWADGAE